MKLNSETVGNWKPQRVWHCARLRYFHRCRTGDTTIWHSPIAMMSLTIFLRAVDQVLFRQWHQFACFLEVLTLQRSSSRERPAGAALCLVLHRGHIALLAPVDLIGGQEVAGGQESRAGKRLVAGLQAVEVFHEFITGLEKMKIRNKWITASVTY